MQIVGKISTKTVVGKVPTQDARVPLVENGEVVTKDGEPVYKTVQRGIKQNLMRVFGQCDAMKPITTNFGTSMEFQGQFEATNALTGEVYRSSKLFIPDLVESIIVAQVEAALAAGKEAADAAGVPFNGKAGVQFAFDIGADSANNAHGYQYTITPLVQAAANDPMEALRAQLLGNIAPLAIGNSAPAETEGQESGVEVLTASGVQETVAPKAASKKK